MKRSICFAALCISLFHLCAQDLRTPQPSPTQTVKQNFALSSVEVSYSRPSIRNRKIFGDLVPYGKVWRTGANSATVITFGDEVTIGGQKVAPGKYGLVSIPGEKEWTIILTKQLDVVSPSLYKADQDLVRVKAVPVMVSQPLENFTIDFQNIQANSMDISIAWDKTRVSVPVTSEVDSKIMKQIESTMGRDNKPYFTAALYYLDNNKDLNKALEWLNKATDLDPNAYWVWHQKANCLAKMGKKTEAAAAANKSIELATTAQNMDYVELNKRLLASMK